MTTTSNGENAEATLSWYEEETMRALRRVAQAKAYLAELEEQAAVASAAPVVTADQADIDRLAELQAEIDKLMPKTQARFGADKARTRIDELEVQMRLILDRAGFGTYDDFLDAGAELPATVEPVDPTVLEFARREVASAETAWMELLSVDMPEPEELSDELLTADTDDDDAAAVDGGDVVSFTRPAASA
jgi:hypothetical protein